MSCNGISRRQFIRTASLGAVSAGLGFPAVSGCRAQKDQKPASDSPALVYRPVGNTGLKFSIVSFGVMNTDSPDLIRQALDAGINHLDTAHVYLRGNSETAIGQVLEASGMRNQVHLATKMYFARDRDTGVFLTEDDGRAPAATAQNFDAQLSLSLERLRTDYVDILYLHNCYGPEMATYEPMLNALVKAKEAGKTRFIGVTTHSREPEVIRAAVDTGVVDVIETAYNFMKENGEETTRAIEYANQKGVGIIAMKTQGGGGLAEEKKATMNHRAALKWVLNDRNVSAAIPGITTFDQLAMNLEVMGDLALTDQEKQDLEMVSAARGTFYCQSCRRCVASCPKGVEIPTLMRAYMYARGYGNVAQAASTVDELPPERSLDACQDCRVCTAICRNGLDISQRLKVLARERVCCV